MSHRRQVLQVATVAMACPLRVLGQRVARIGVLSNWSLKTVDGATAPVWAAFYGELGKRGWIEGRNLVVETRLVSNILRYDAAAAELLVARPEVILGTSSNAIAALRQASNTVPIVMVTVGSAVEAGFVQSLARPGGNVTGVTSTATGNIQDKRVQLLQGMTPNLKKLAILWDPKNSGSFFGFRAAQDTAKRFGLQLASFPIEQRGDIEPALTSAVQQGVQALQVHPTTRVDADVARLAAWAIENRIATIGQLNDVPGGFLMAYGPDIPDQFRIAATYVDRILRGSRAEDLPVEMPILFRFSLNLTTAKALRLTVPQELLLRADEVIR